MTGFVFQGHICQFSSPPLILILILIQIIIFVFKHQIEWKLNSRQNKCITIVDILYRLIDIYITIVKHKHDKLKKHAVKQNKQINKANHNTG